MAFKNRNKKGLGKCVFVAALLFFVIYLQNLFIYFNLPLYIFILNLRNRVKSIQKLLAIVLI